MASYFPLHLHSHYSFLDGLSQVPKIIERLKECGYTGSAVTDHGNISCCPDFNASMQKAKLKPILGSEFYIAKYDATKKEPANTNSHLVVLAKNAEGWRNLMKASSASYLPEFSYRKPRLDLERLAAFGKGQFVTFSGHLGSDLANCIFEEPKLAYRAKNLDDVRSMVRKDWNDVVTREIQKYQALFGKENFWVEINIVDHENLPAALGVAHILRRVAKKLGAPCVATADSHYARRQDAADQRILLCSAFNTTLQQVERDIESGEDVSLGGFFKSNNYHIPSLEEMNELHRDHPEELEESCRIAERCETYVLGGRPMLPRFDTGNLTADEYLERLCQKGWDKLVIPVLAKHPELFQEYHDRLHKIELPVLRKARLSDYFLIVQDFIRFAVEDLRTKTGRGRGSGAGCFTSYLSGITRIDPLEAKLSFARFYNDGRNTADRVALPDIDTDFQVEAREPVFEYLRQKYGHERVGQIATFSTMQGKGAVKDVLRAHGSVSYEEMNRITKNIPDEFKIADKLEEMRQATGGSSIIQWTLENLPEDLKEWVWVDPTADPNSLALDGPLAIEFAQAIRLEGTVRSMGRHASALVICSEPLSNIAPMAWDKSTEQMYLGVDMIDCEKLGLVKFDILGLRTLDCLSSAERFIRTGKLRK